MRTKLLKAVTVFALLAILLGMPLLLTPHRIRPSTIALIKAGMTETDVEDLLGAKAGNYDGYCSGFVNISHQWSFDPRPMKSWVSRHGSVDVYFDSAGRVTSKLEHSAAPNAWWARLWNEFFPQSKIEDW